jgi:CDP-paratose synthetase
MDLNRKTIILTGPTGFLGSHLLNYLVKKDELNIICFKRSFSNTERIKKIKSPNLKFIDIDCTEIESIFKSYSIDVILHTATQYGRSNESISKVLGANLMFPIKIIDLGIKYNVKCFINTDSFFNKPNFSYSHLLDYSLSKKSLLIWMKHLQNKIPICNVILEHIYGENDGSKKFVENSIQTIAFSNHEEIKLTYGHQRRDFIYIEDVVTAYDKILNYCLTQKFTYKTFEVGCGKSVEVAKLIKVIKQLSGSKINLNFGAVPYFSDEIMDSKANIEEMLKIGWRPKYSIEEGISKILEFYNNKGNV